MAHLEYDSLPILCQVSGQYILVIHYLYACLPTRSLEQEMVTITISFIQCKMKRSGEALLDATGHVPLLRAFQRDGTVAPGLDVQAVLFVHDRQ